MNNKSLFGIGIVIAVLMVFAVPAAAGNVMYFDPDPSCAADGEEITVALRANTSDGTAVFQCDVYFDTSVVDITNVVVGNYDLMFAWSDYGSYVRASGMSTDGMDYPPGNYVLAYYTLVANSSYGASSLDFQVTSLGDQYGADIPNQVWNDGTFNCPCLTPETVTKPLPNKGWNLLSLPLTATDNSVSAVLSTVSQDAVRQYDPTTKTFVDATTMDPGIGYFVNVTTAGTWEYEGTPVSSTSPGLESGLNMIGVPNCTMDVGTAMGSADYWYVSRWNANDQKYEVHNPSAPSTFHGFTTMTAGEGYFVSANSDNSEFEITCSS